MIVVAHSMGGLVARYWIGRLGGWQVCDALTTLGTPHRGAPKAADWLVNGATVKGCRLDGATEVLRSWPSVYELLPTYKAVALGSDAYGYCHELAFAPLDGADAKAAAALHADIAAGWQAVPTGEGALEVKPVYGFGHDTAMALVVAPDGVRSTVDDAARVDGAELKGDGTVPWVSAIPPELSEEKRAWQAAALRHGVLTDVDGVVEFVKTVTAPGSLADVRGAAEPDDRPAVGTQGLETETIAGERLSFTLTVRGYPDDIDPSAWAVSLQPVVPDSRTPPAPGAVPTIVIEPARTTALVRTGPLAPGRYDLTIRARLDLDTDPLPIRESVLVVEP